jgi:DNA-binding response OmpR family regulator
MASKPLVIVADDEPAMNELVSRHLRAMTSPSVEVIQAHDGAQAWGLVRKHKPDVVVLDVMMPEMSGWEVCRKIREDEGLEKTGVVMLTGIGETLNSLTSPLYGADDYLDKPFRPDDLARKVKAVLAARSGAKEVKPAAKKPAAKKPAAKKPAAKKPAAKKAAAKKPAAKKVPAKKAAKKAAKKR